MLPEGGSPCRLDYTITCDPGWVTRSVEVSGWVGARDVKIAILVDNGQWVMNSERREELGGCVDIDLNFSPSTNLLPIRRLKLRAGEQAEVKAAWLRFPSFSLEPFEQTYTRLGRNTYRYTSAGGKFTRELTVNDAGLVTLYPGLWQAI